MPEEPYRATYRVEVRDRDPTAAGEARVFARSVVRVVSGDDDYACWLLHEIPGGEWFFMEGTARDADYARAELVLARLWPSGPALEARASGDALPIRGASTDRDVDGSRGRCARRVISSLPWRTRRPPWSAWRGRCASRSSTRSSWATPGQPSRERPSAPWISTS